MTQYTDYSTVPAQVQNLVAAQCKLLDTYILFQTGNYEYTAKIKSLASKKIRQMRIWRTSSTGYSNYWRMEISDASDFDFTVTNQYYVFSNVGYGQLLDLHAYKGVQSFSLAAITAVLFFAIIFKGALFKCLRKLRR